MEVLKAGWLGWLRPDRTTTQKSSAVDGALVAVFASLIVVSCLLWG